MQLCSAGGLVVGQYGMTAARTVDLTNIKKYLRWLTVLALACISMRIIWIFDLFDLIAKKKAMDEHLQVRPSASYRRLLSEFQLLSCFH